MSFSWGRRSHLPNDTGNSLTSAVGSPALLSPMPIARSRQSSGAGGNTCTHCKYWKRLRVKKHRPRLRFCRFGFFITPSLLGILMEQDHMINIEEIMGQLKCRKDFQCCMSGFEDLCKAQSIEVGEVSLLICLQKNGQKCKLVAVDRGDLCKCPFRIYVARKLKK